MRDGHGIVVDIDLEKFFDRVNHDILMGRLAKRIKDKRLLKIIRRFLETGMMMHGIYMDRCAGTGKFRKRVVETIHESPSQSRYE